MPQFLKVDFRIVRETFEKHGIYVVERFPDGQIIWGTEPPGNSPYLGKFTITDHYIPGVYDMFTIRAVLEKLVDPEKAEEIETTLFNAIVGVDG